MDYRLHRYTWHPAVAPRAAHPQVISEGVGMLDHAETEEKASQEGKGVVRALNGEVPDAGQ